MPSRLRRYVALDSQRAGPRTFDESPGNQRFQPTPLFGAARGEAYTGARWTSRTPQSKVTDLTSDIFVRERMAKRVHTGESLQDYTQRQRAVEKTRMLPKDVSFWM